MSPVSAAGMKPSNHEIINARKNSFSTSGFCEHPAITNIQIDAPIGGPRPEKVK